MGKHPGSPSNVIIKVFKSRRSRKQREAERDVTTESEIREMHCENSALCGWLWRWRSDHKECGLVLEAEKSKEIESSLELPERSTTLKRLFWTSNLRNCKIIDMCCIKNRTLMHLSGRVMRLIWCLANCKTTFLSWAVLPCVGTCHSDVASASPCRMLTSSHSAHLTYITSLSWAPAHCRSLLSFLCPCELSPPNSHCPDSLDLAISAVIIQWVALPAVAACVFILVPKLNWNLGLKQELCFVLLLLFLRTCTFFFFHSPVLTTFDTESHCPGIHL